MMCKPPGLDSAMLIAAQCLKSCGVSSWPKRSAVRRIIIYSVDLLEIKLLARNLTNAGAAKGSVNMTNLYQPR
jgi:hypothetical protein